VDVLARPGLLATGTYSEPVLPFIDWQIDNSRAFLPFWQQHGLYCFLYWNSILAEIAKVFKFAGFFMACCWYNLDQFCGAGFDGAG